MSIKRILLTGANGFIGKNLRESFLFQKYHFECPSRAELDLSDDESVAQYFRSKQFDIVIHSAVKPGHRNAKDPTGLLFSNTRMYFNLIRHQDRWGQMLFIGSGSEYSSKHYMPRMSEEYFGTHIPEDEHGFSKYISRMHMEKSQNVTDLVVFSIFGKYEDYAIRFVSNMICKCLLDLPLTMNRNRKFDFLWVNDLNLVIDHFIEQKPVFRSYNVTPDETVYLYDLACQIRSLANKDHLPIKIKHDGLDLEYSGENSRLKAEIPNFKPTPFFQSIPVLLDWYRSNLSNLDLKCLLTDK